MINSAVACHYEATANVNIIKVMCQLPYSLHGRDVQRKHVANNVDGSSLRAPYKKARLKTLNMQNNKT